jgi:hypothetical protein
MPGIFRRKLANHRNAGFRCYQIPNCTQKSEYIPATFASSLVPRHFRIDGVRLSSYEGYRTDAGRKLG